MADEKRLTITIGDRTVFDCVVQSYEYTVYSPHPDGTRPDRDVTLSAIVKRAS